MMWFAVAALVVAMGFTSAFADDKNADEKIKLKLGYKSSAGNDGGTTTTEEKKKRPDKPSAGEEKKRPDKIKLGRREFKFKPSASNTDETTTKKKLPLGAFLSHGWIWGGGGNLNSEKWDGDWISFEGGMNLSERIQLYFGRSDYSGEGPGTGSTNKYRGTGEELRMGLQCVDLHGVSTKIQDEARIAYVMGEDSGKSASYLQETKFRAFDFRLARTWFAHYRSFLSGGTIEFKWRHELNSSKDSSFLGKKLNRTEDPIDGSGVRYLQLSPDLVQKLLLKERLRCSLAAVYERQWWEDQSPRERDLYGIRIRLAIRTKKSGQGNLDVTSYRGESNEKASKGGFVGFGWSF